MEIEEDNLLSDAECVISGEMFEADDVMGYLSDYPVRFVDVAGSRSWNNDEATAVFVFDKELTYDGLLRFTETLHRLSPDEYEYQCLAGNDGVEKPVFRLWWD